LTQILSWLWGEVYMILNSIIKCSS